MVLQSPRLDLQRQRLKCLLANAILELWKKETGSLSSVLIEGTICITSGNGKTTVVQVSDKFYGTVPGSESLDSSYGQGGRYPSIPSDCSGSVGQWNHVVSPTGTGRDDGYQSHETESDSSGTLNYSKQGNPKKDNQETSSPQSAKKAKVSTENTTLNTSDSRNEHNSSSEYNKEPIDPKYGERDENFNTPMAFGVGGFCPGTGYYTSCLDNQLKKEHAKVLNDKECDKEKSDTGSSLVSRDKEADKQSHDDDDQDNDNDQDDSDNELTIDTGADEDDHAEQKEEHVDEEDDNRVAMDLSRKDIDLAVMSPHNYTAQVRSVIRQRLLAGKSSPESPTEGDKPEDERETPQPLKSLGLHRSPNSSDGEGETSPETSPETETSPTVPHKPWPLLAINNVVNQVGLVQNLPPGMPPFVNGMPPFPLLTPISRSASAMAAAASSYLQTPPGPLHNILKRKAPVPPTLVPYGHPLLQGAMPPTSPHLTSPPLPLRSPSSHSSKEASPTSPHGSDKDSSGTSPEQRVYKCDFCNKTFLFKSKYHEHLPVHTNARPFQCHLCSRTYKYKYDLRVHLRTHMGIPTKSTVCPFCTIKFETNKQLRLHIKEAHRDQQKVSEEDCTDPRDNLPPAL